MRNIGFFKLRSIEHLDRGGLSVGTGSRRCDMAAGDLRALQLEALHMGHVVSETAICNVAGNGTGGIRCSGCHRRNGSAVQGCTISRCDTAKSSCKEACTTAKAHSLTALNDGVAHITVGTETRCKASCKALACGTWTASNVATAPEYVAGTTYATANAGDDPGSHEQFHTKTASGLGNIQANGSKIAVKPLCRLEVCQGTEEPQEYRTFAGGQSTAVCHELSHGGRKTSQKPDIHNK